MTETPIPVQFDAETLDDGGRRLRRARDADDRAPAPRPRDRRHAQLRRQARAAQRVPLLPARPRRPPSPRSSPPAPVAEPAYMHSFGLTRALARAGRVPVRRQPDAARLRGRPYIENYRWKPERGTRFTLFDRATGEPGRPVRDRRVVLLPPRQRLRRRGRAGRRSTCSVRGRVDDRRPLPRAAARGRKPRVAEPTIERLTVRPGAARPGASSARRSSSPASSSAGSTTAAATSAPTATPGACAGDRRLARGDRPRRPRDARAAALERARLLPGRAGLRRPARGRGRGRRRPALGRARRRAPATPSCCPRRPRLSELARAEAPHHIPFGFHGQFARA